MITYSRRWTYPPSFGFSLGLPENFLSRVIKFITFVQPWLKLNTAIEGIVVDGAEFITLSAKR